MRRLSWIALVYAIAYVAGPFTGLVLSGVAGTIDSYEFVIPDVFGLAVVILECLAKDSDARPASATVVSERLARLVPADAWTSDAARCWWERHQPLNRMQTTTTAAVDDGTATLIAGPRCRPRWEGRPLGSLTRG